MLFSVTPPSTPALSRAADFREPPAWLCLWLPLAMYLFIYSAGFVVEHGFYKRHFVGEMSVVEIPTVLVLIAAIVMGIRALRHAHALRMRPLVAWLLLGTLGCIYFAGEEASWGQWYLRWSTPEAWAALNDQEETNLHNLAGVGFLLDQLPRALLTLGAFVGGIVVPLYLKLRGQSLNPARLWYWIWPTLAALPTAVLGVFLARIDRSLSEIVGHDWPFYDLRTGELKEFMLAFFLLVYLASLATRLNQLRQATRP
ncbi:MAG TPA: hypothetical protein VNJ47_14160 [Nevskiales bacterium]|nr:hypothetical protein [Nevskiales bacterium]